MADDAPEVNPTIGLISAPVGDLATQFTYKNCPYAVDQFGNVWQRHLSKLGWINIGVTIPAPAP